MIRRVILGALLAPFWLLAISPSDGAEANTAEPDRSMHQEVLELGFWIASSIPTQHYALERGDCQYRLLKALEQEQHYELALELAELVENYRHGVFLAEQAQRLARGGDGPAAEALVTQATESAENVRRLGPKKAWQVERVMTEIAKAESALDEIDATGKKKQTGASNRDFGFAIEQALQLANEQGVEPALNELVRIARSQEWNVRKEVGRALAELVRRLGEDATKEQCEQVLAALTEVSQGLHAFARNELHGGLCRALAGGGNQAIARRELDRLVETYLGSQLRARFDVGELCRLASVCRTDFADADRADELLAQAAELAEDESLGALDRPRVLGELAKEFAANGDRAEAWQYFREALRCAGRLQNAHPRHTNLAEVCALIGTTSLPVPEDILPLIHAELERKVSAW